MNYEILNSINSISDVKMLSRDKIEDLCDEIREFLIDKVGQNGGHLASNLGVVELSVALHRVFDSPEDHIIFDVGHQSYVHKLLTGRQDDFDTLRTPGGLSGFTTRKESAHDPFGSGHSSTSVSAALGFAEADKLLGKDNYTVAIVGDGAFTGGMIHEALNNCKPDLNLIVVLNENGMSISSNRGAFASYLANVRASKRYIAAKKSTKSFLESIPLIGKPVTACASAIKKLVKRVIYRTNYFEDLGFYYIGVVDGNDEEKVERDVQKARQDQKVQRPRRVAHRAQDAVKLLAGHSELHKINGLVLDPAFFEPAFRLFGVEAFRLAEDLNVQYSTSIRHRPWGGIRKPASARFPSNSSGILSASRWPRPTSTRVPTRIRTMLWRKPLPLTVMRISSPVRSTFSQ